jgi:hypothetical protein
MTIYEFRVQVIPQDHQFQLEGTTYELNVVLNSDYTVDLITLNHPEKRIAEKGFWSMIYDQGFFFWLPT